MIERGEHRKTAGGTRPRQSLCIPVAAGSKSYFVAKQVYQPSTRGSVPTPSDGPPGPVRRRRTWVHHPLNAAGERPAARRCSPRRHGQPWQSLIAPPLEAIARRSDGHGPSSAHARAAACAACARRGCSQAHQGGCEGSGHEREKAIPIDRARETASERRGNQMSRAHAIDATPSRSCVCSMAWSFQQPTADASPPGDRQKIIVRLGLLTG